jgi:hypothetical protein
MSVASPIAGPDSEAPDSAEPTRNLEAVDAPLEPLTPELALVDPELALRARALLPEPGEREPRERPVTVRRRARQLDRGLSPASYASLFELATPESSEGQAADVPATHAPRPRRRRRVIGATGVLLVLAAGAAVLARADLRERTPLLRDLGANREAGASSQRGKPETAVRPATENAAVTSGGATARPRVFAWVPSRRATHYRVRIFAGRQTIFEAWPLKPRLSLPTEWTYRGRDYRLHSGRYRWEVEPGYGRPGHGRYGKAIVRASLVVR